jgi:hypothetical protein
MLTVEFPSGSSLSFDSSQALARAVQQIRAGTPIIARSEKDGRREIVWAPGDEDRAPALASATSLNPAPDPGSHRPRREQAFGPLLLPLR